jgi:eukaryotic-like serine/threonine-protein kinase
METKTLGLSGTSLEALEPDDPGRVGPYTIVGRLFKGRNSRVYLAHDSDPTTQYAIKMLPPGEQMDPVRRERLSREASYAQSVHSPYVARVVYVAVGETRPYIVQEYIDGPTLTQELDTAPGARLTGGRVAGLALGLLEGLADIHAAGVVHRDLKPSNVVMNVQRGPVLLDFSIAWQYGADRLTETNAVPMTVGYASPEQLSGRRVDPASDIFSWAVVVARSASGCHPFGMEPSNILMERIKNGEPDLDGVPEWLRPALARCLAKDPATRPPARALLRELAARRREFAAPAAPPPTLVDPEPWDERRYTYTPREPRRPRVGLGARLLHLLFVAIGDEQLDWTDPRTYQVLQYVAVVAGVALGLLTAFLAMAG